MTVISNKNGKKKPDANAPSYLPCSSPSSVQSESGLNDEIYPWILTKTLYYHTIRAGLYLDNLGMYHYLVKIKRLSQEENQICKTVHEEIKKKISVSRSENHSRSAILSLISRKSPDIAKGQRELIATYLFFRYDPTRWIRLFIQDNDITGIFCPAPDTPVLISYSGYQDMIVTNITLQRVHLDKLARVFLSSAKIDPNSVNIPDHIKFKSGIQVSLIRHGDSAGWFWRLSIQKNRTYNENHEERKVTSNPNPTSKKKISIPPPVNGKNPGNTRKKPAVRTQKNNRPSEQRIDELLTTIFTQDSPSKSREISAIERKEEEDIPVSTAGLMDRLISPVKEGLQVLSSKNTGAKIKTPSRDPPPIPETMQAPSVLNVQTGDGIVAEEAYWLYQPHAYVAILQDQKKDRTYRVVEPELNPRERIILEETHETLRDVLVYDKPLKKGDLFLDYTEVAKVVKTYDPDITEDRLSVLFYYLRRNLNGYGKIDAIMYDELLEDISCNGHNLPVYIHHRYYGSIPTSIRFDSDELNKFVLKLSQKADKHVSLTSPLLDASLPNGARAQITYSDIVSTKGSSFTIRKFRTDPMTPATLMAFGTYNDKLLAFIWLALENRQSLIVVGGTASGKTSTMNAFAFFIPHNSKIVSLEDTREIQIPQKNWLPVQTRASSSANDRGSIDLFDLLKASLRQRPEYIIVGEVRGSEAQTLFQAMNSGHTTLSTLHAGNIEEALNRLTNEPINVPPAMFGALNLMVIQTFHYREGRMIRRCDAIHEIILGQDDKIGWNTLFEYNPKIDSYDRMYTQSKTLRTIQYMHNWSDEEIQYQLRLRAKFLAKLRNQYSTDPELLIQMITDLRRRA